jgi:hypothetical protein
MGASTYRLRATTMTVMLLQLAATQLTVRGRDGVETVTSTCEYHYENMSYKAAKKSSKNAPCTNVPIHCSLCPLSVSREPQTIWKYNAINHLLISHSDEDPTQAGKYKLPVIPGDLMMDMFVTRQEEQWMKINPIATATFRREEEEKNRCYMTRMNIKLINS